MLYTCSKVLLQIYHIGNVFQIMLRFKTNLVASSGRYSKSNMLMAKFSSLREYPGFRRNLVSLTGRTVIISGAAISPHSEAV